MEVRVTDSVQSLGTGLGGLLARAQRAGSVRPEAGRGDGPAHCRLPGCVGGWMGCRPAQTYSGDRLCRSQARRDGLSGITAQTGLRRLLDRFTVSIERVLDRYRSSVMAKVTLQTIADALGVS